MKYISRLRKAGIGASVADQWGSSLNYLMSAVVGGGLTVMGIMTYMQTQVCHILSSSLCTHTNSYI